MTDSKLASIFRKKHPEEVSVIMGYPKADPDIFLIPSLAHCLDTEFDRLVFVGIVLKRFSPFTLLECLKMEAGVARQLQLVLNVHINTVTCLAQRAYVYYKGNAKFRDRVDNYGGRG